MVPLREAFITKKFQPRSMAIITKAVEICEDYRAQGFDLTVRQLYYQFVSRDLIPNSDKSYNSLKNLISEARLAGLLDWDFITDRHREHHGSFWGWEDPGHWIRRTIQGDNYHEAIWEDQPYRPEVWVEKDALTDVISRACNRYRVPYFACKGYVSSSAMYEAAKRFSGHIDDGHTPVVIHLGDHDPSGIDMTRDIRERLTLMSYEDIEVRRIALTMAQVEAYDAPPNPAKLSDARAEQYVATYGNQSWELDALEPAVMVDLIQSEITGLIEGEPWNEAIEHEEEGQAVIQAIADRWPEIEQFLTDNPLTEE